MTMTPPPPARALEVRRLLGDSFRMLQAHFGVLFLLAFAPALLEEAAFVAVLPGLQDSAQMQQVTPTLLLAALVSSVISHLIIAVVTVAAIDCAAGARRTLGEYVALALRNVIPLMVIGVILSLAAGFAALFFVVPGLYVYAQFFVWLPVLLVEGRGLGALARAQDMTRGHRWPLVGAILMLGALFLLVLMALGPLIGSLSTAVSGVLGAVLASAMSALGYAVFAIFGALVYLRLRYLEDGTEPAEIAASV